MLFYFRLETDEEVNPSEFNQDSTEFARREWTLPEVDQQAGSSATATSKSQTGDKPHEKPSKKQSSHRSPHNSRGRSGNRPANWKPSQDGNSSQRPSFQHKPRHGSDRGGGQMSGPRRSQESRGPDENRSFDRHDRDNRERERNRDDRDERSLQDNQPLPSSESISSLISSSISSFGSTAFYSQTPAANEPTMNGTTTISRLDVEVSLIPQPAGQFSALAVPRSGTDQFS
jgi:hypothetical protein